MINNRLKFQLLAWTLLEIYQFKSLQQFTVNNNSKSNRKL